MSFDPFGTFRRASTGTSAGRGDAQPAGSGARNASASSGTPAQKKRRPTTARTAAWHERSAWKRTGRQLLRWYTKRSDFRLTLRPGRAQPLACVDLAAKRVEVTTAFPQAGPHTDFRPSGVRHAHLLAARPTEVWLRGLIGHEAGHILFSGEKPTEQVLGWLWNALEDERMERLVAARYGERIGRIFETIGDVMLSETSEERSQRLRAKKDADARATAGSGAPRPRDVLSACLQWRWLKDHAAEAAPAGTAGYHPYLTLPEPAFERARPLVEKAWSAPTSAGVTEIARELLAMFDIPEDRAVPGELDAFDLPVGAAPAPGNDPAGSSDDGEPDGEDGPPTGGGAPQPEAEGENEPDVPALDPQGELAECAADLLDGQRAGAKALAEALRPEQRRRIRTPHRSRGRFEYRRYARGRGRVFSRRPDRPAPPAFLTVLLDLSGSMNAPASENDDTPLIEHAKRCVALLSGAAEMAPAPLRLIPFCEEAGAPLSSRAVGHEMLRAAAASARAQGRTKLAPALRAAFSWGGAASPSGEPFGLHVVALISDGELEEQDAQRCQRIYQRARRGGAAGASGAGAPLVLPLLLGAATSAESERGRPAGQPAPEEVYERIFRRYAAVRSAEDLPEVAARWIKHAT